PASDRAAGVPHPRIRAGGPAWSGQHRCGGSQRNELRPVLFGAALHNGRTVAFNAPRNTPLAQGEAQLWQPSLSTSPHVTTSTSSPVSWRPPSAPESTTRRRGLRSTGEPSSRPTSVTRPWPTCTPTPSPHTSRPPAPERTRPRSPTTRSRPPSLPCETRSSPTPDRPDERGHPMDGLD